MSEVTIYHNPRCSKSRAALAVCQEAGVDATVVEYLKHPLNDDALRTLVTILVDEPTALVRRDAAFAEAGLTEADVATGEGVAAVLAAHPELMERPVLVRGGTAIIGRPTERVAPFITG